MKEPAKEIVEMIENQLITVDFISAIAGDRNASDKELAEFKIQLRRKGNELFSDMLYALTPKRYKPEESLELWNKIVLHKEKLTDMIHRNPGIVVAATDYLLNIHETIDSPVVIPEKKIDTIVSAAALDSLTGLYSKSIFTFLLTYEIKQFKRHKSPFSLMMIDIDDFKEINDTHGHIEGDNTLQKVGEIIEKSIREVDTAARFGGDEFILLLPETKQKKAETTAKRIQQMIQDYFTTIPVTLSIGISTLLDSTEEISVPMVIERADTALYISKENGKNQINCY